ncbi:MAG: sulfate reduction electron transfer complex DsrMKJOP subunit DsrO [Desulfovibrionaceae bacterium]
MKSSRRKFLKVAGISALGLAASPALEALTHAAPEAHAAEYAPKAEALQAKRWAMVIDTTKFESAEDFDKVIEACHSFHNVPTFGDKQEVKWIWTDTYHRTFPEQINNHMNEEVEERKYLLLCNHCTNPPCVRVCPTKATFQRPDGIVIMDMHRCIGCRFCMAACPFGARSFNFKNPRPGIAETNPTYPTRMRGVVEKCNFCAELLGKGELPKCVQAAEGAILFGDLDDPESEVRQALAEHFSLRRKPNLGTEPGVYYII